MIQGGRSDLMVVVLDFEDSKRERERERERERMIELD